MASSTERELGNRWLATRMMGGAWGCKLPSSSLAGLPDWLVLHGGIELWEAKKVLPGKTAYRPKQLSGAQRFFVRMIALYAPDSGGVLLLSEDGFAEVPAKRALKLVTAKTFRRMKEPYHDGG